MALNETAIAERLIEVPGVVGVVLGGSRASGTHTVESDYDLGLYYQGGLDTARLGELAVDVAGPGARVTAVGEWGPWVNGGGWLRIDGAAVDWLYRDLEQVRQCWSEAEQGTYRFHVQAGHPLGVPDHSYAGELALARILADPTGDLADLQRRVRVFPRPLAEALVAGLWEADFLVGIARKAVTRGDSAYVAGCLFRSVGVVTHALHGAAGRWLINEKGAVAAAADLPGAPAGFRSKVDRVFATIGPDPMRLTEAIDLTEDVVLETVDACAMMLR